MYYHKFAYGFSSNNHFKDFWSFSTPCAMNHMHSAGIVVTNFICIKLANIFMFHSLGSHCNFFWKKYFNAQSLYDRANIKEQDFAIEFALPPVAHLFHICSTGSNSCDMTYCSYQSYIPTILLFTDHKK